MKPTAKSRIYIGEYSEDAVIEVARGLHRELGSNAALGFLFVSQEWHAHLSDTLELIRVHGRVPELVGCSGRGIIGAKTEVERRPGFSLLLLSMPPDSFKVFPVTENQYNESSDPRHWRAVTGLPANAVNSWIVLANPYFPEAEEWLEQWSEAYPGTPTIGGLASSATSEILLFRDGEISSAFALAVALKGCLRAQPVISQGCRPIGNPMPITKVDDNLIIEVGNVPAYKALEAAFLSVPVEQRVTVKNNLFLGLAISEYIEEYKRGDFLIRNILGADPKIGAVAVGANPRVGQTIQFQLRDSISAHEDLVQIAEMGRVSDAIGILLFSCTGRGRALFGKSDHDATVLAEVLGDLPLAGFFCNGEIGPVGNKTFLHGYTASAAVLCVQD